MYGSFAVMNRDSRIRSREWLPNDDWWLKEMYLRELVLALNGEGVIN